MNYILATIVLSIIFADLMYNIKNKGKELLK